MLKTNFHVLGLLISLLVLPLTGCALFQPQGSAAAITQAPTIGDITQIPVYSNSTAAITAAPPTIIPPPKPQPTLSITSVPYVVPTLPRMTSSPAGTAEVSLMVTKIEMSVDNSTIKVTCPHAATTFNLQARIWTNKPGNITYYWEFSTGSNTGQATTPIGSNLNQIVTTTLTTNSAGTYWARIREVAPNNKGFNQVAFKLVCQ